VSSVHKKRSNIGCGHEARHVRWFGHNELVIDDAHQKPYNDLCRQLGYLS